MAYPQSKFRFTPEEYLTFERAAETKHEYIDGFIYAMAGGSPPHNRICFNVIASIGPHLRETECFGFTSDQKIRTDPQDLFSYPDITIVCGEPVFHDHHKDVVLNPKVIIEVLSPSTETHDRVEKFARYRTIKTLTDYLLIAQDRASIEHFSNQKGKSEWLYSAAIGLPSAVKLTSINCALKLAAVYDRIVFPPPKPVLVPVPDKEVKEALAAQKPKRAKKR
ncbi:MAG: Uma2 family endonuclease [Acidobacteria bacterium]|nr:Uma2 family endonuclease [Acidobacteriota bacterium]MBI3426912.1 Uma2 family endonuclease [Acidobacteriota bacterium]